KDGAPCAMKVARTVRRRGKGGDRIKPLPISIISGTFSKNEVFIM
ncbi:hypothetical protein M2277_006488, partial [Paenibacillus sp. LBL]|nr:hypothetical protein [Paenibacillus sp. LBL]